MPNFDNFFATLELSFNSNEFGGVLLVTPSMLGKLEVHASEVVWRFEPITSHIGELRVKLILAPHVAKWKGVLSNVEVKKPNVPLSQSMGV